LLKSSEYNLLKMNTMKMMTQLVCVAVLIGCASAAFNYTCYSCNSVSDSTNCQQTFGNKESVATEGGCSCCTKNDANKIISRGCSKQNVGDCIPTWDNSVCFGNLCNKATPIEHHVIVTVLLAALGLAVYFRRN